MGHVTNIHNVQVNHLSVRVLQGIPRDAIVTVPPTVHRIDLNFILYYFYSHLITHDTQNVSTLEPQTVTFDHIQWFYKVSHPYIILNDVGHHRKITFNKIVRKGASWDDHAHYVLSIYWCIATLAKDAIVKKILGRQLLIRPHYRSS